MKDYSAQEELVDSYVRQNDIKAAVKLLCEMIVESARNRDFALAEAFRSKLLKVDAFALPEILECTDIIEEEKRQAIEERHSNLWADLYKKLSPLEGNALYYALKKEVYHDTDTIFVQGELHARLYFIHRGRLALIWRDSSRETIIREVGPGEVVVADGFFSDSVCTVSLAALTRVEAAYLEKAVLLQWQKEFPALENKLVDFCRGHQDTSVLVKKRGVDRRSHSRIKVRATIGVQLLSDGGAPIAKAFRGELLNISRGGTAFLIPVRKRETARALLGRKVAVAFAMPQPTPTFKATKRGRIVAITHFPFEGHYLHVRFDEVLSEGQTELLLLLPREGSSSRP
ncbi:MAG: cyclic nucleotide-binding domain-containing protein [Syntrophobacteraceae bacterium]